VGATNGQLGGMTNEMESHGNRNSLFHASVAELAFYQATGVVSPFVIPSNGDGDYRRRTL